MKISGVLRVPAASGTTHERWKLGSESAMSRPPREPNPLERLRFGVLLVTREAQILSANRIARQLLDSRDGLTTTSGRLVALSARQTTTLHELIAASQQPNQGDSYGLHGLRIPRPRAHIPLQVVISSVPSSEHCPAAGPLAAVYIIDPSLAADGRAHSFARQHGLTPAEARVATVIANGSNGRLAARLLGVSYNTIKTHLKRIYSKTGVDGHSALMRLLLVAPEVDCLTPSERLSYKQISHSPRAGNHPRG